MWIRSRTLFASGFIIGILMLIGPVHGHGITPAGELLPDGSWMLYEENMEDQSWYGEAIAMHLLRSRGWLILEHSYRLGRR